MESPFSQRTANPGAWLPCRGLPPTAPLAAPTVERSTSRRGKGSTDYPWRIQASIDRLSAPWHLPVDRYANPREKGEMGRPLKLSAHRLDRCRGGLLLPQA